MKEHLKNESTDTIDLSKDLIDKFICEYILYKKNTVNTTHQKLNERNNPDNFGYRDFEKFNSSDKPHFKNWLMKTASEVKIKDKYGFFRYDFVNVNILEDLNTDENNKSKYCKIAFELPNGGAVGFQFDDILYQYIKNVSDVMTGHEIPSAVFVFNEHKDYNYQDLLLDCVAIGFILSPILFDKLYNTKLEFAHLEHQIFLERYILNIGIKESIENNMNSYKI